MLKIKNIDVFRGSTHVLHSLSLEVKHGEIVSLIGANGAGKTTTLRTISGLLHPKNGEILYRANVEDEYINIQKLSPDKIVKLGISQTPEGRGIFPQLSVKENLLIGAYNRTDDNIEDTLLSMYEMFPILEKRENLEASKLSGGEQMMLALGRSLMSEPKFLILDEPSLGLAPLIVEQIFQMLERINKQGVTILLVEQNAVMAMELSNRTYVIETGKIVLSGESSQLATNKQVQDAYLGGIK